MRTQPIPSAYRTFFRQIGLDPDTTRIPSEAAAVARLLQGAFEPTTLVEDARLIALIETGIPLWVIDADLVDPAGLGIRTTVAGDRLGSDPDANYILPGRLAVADAQSVHALLFGDVAPDHRARSKTGRVALFAVSVEGVPAIHVEEALWVCVEVLNSRVMVVLVCPAGARLTAWLRAAGGKLRLAIKGGSHGAPRAGKDAPQVLIPPSAAIAPGRVSEHAQRAARRSMRAQIARLERELSGAFVTAFELGCIAPAGRTSGDPRLLDLGELEQVRDELADRLRAARIEITELAEIHSANRVLLERMLLEPGKYRFVRVARRDLGEPGCGVWQVRPRMGLIGMLAGWWQVKLSSGCPLARGRSSALRPAPLSLSHR